MRLDVAECPRGVLPPGIEISLNGHVLATCLMADEERGEVLLYVIDSRGRRIPCPDDPRGFVTVRARGQVQIRQAWPA